ncbi:MAG TPA: hypothetical protein VGC19_14470, partial [Rhodanobacter sp.]
MKGLAMRANTNGRLNQTCLTPTLPVSPVTRAIRAALAISVTLLALGSSSAAFAQSCVFTAPETEICEGAFTSTLPDPSLFTPVADLTLVFGDSAHSVPTSVNPAVGLMGIDANWGGNVGVSSYADITTQGADGIFVDSTATATVNNQGSITTGVTADGSKALDVNAFGDISIINNGAIDAYSTDVYDVTAVNAYSVNGNVSVDNQASGTINATAQDGNAIAMNASAYGALIVANEGAIRASTVNGIAAGVIAQATDGNASITNSGSITATSINYEAVGILAASNNGYATVTNSGNVTATGGQDQAIGISASGYFGATVQNTHNVTATSSYGEAMGIQAQTYNGDASVTNHSGTITSTSSSQYQAAIGVFASSINGQATVTNSGTIKAVNQPGLAVGLEAYSEHGSSNIANSSYVLAATAVGSATGLLANSTYGDVDVSNTSGNIRALATTGGSVAYGIGSYGIGISAESTNGNVSVSNHYGTIYGASLHGTGIGIRAHAGGDVHVNNDTYSYITTVGKVYGNAIGIDAHSTAGTVTVTNAGHVTGYAEGQLGTYHDINHVTGIQAVAAKGVTVATTGYSYINAHGSWYSTGIYTGAYSGTSITTSAGGKFQSSRIIVSGLVAKGIYAIETSHSSAGYGIGDVTINNASSISVTQTGDFQNLSLPRLIEYGTGISVLSSFGGAISVTNSGSIGVDTQHGGAGIEAYGVFGQVSEDNSGSIAVSGSGTHFRLFGEYGHSAYSISGVNLVNSGDITITTPPVVGSYTAYSGTNLADGIYGRAGRAGSPNFSGGGDVILLNTGHVTVSSDFSYGMVANSQYGTAMATNAGNITLNSGFSSVGISVAAGNTVAPNTGLGAIVDNSGIVSATGANNAIGLRTYSRGNSVGSLPLEITNSGDVTATAQVRAQGVLAFVFNADPLTVDNSGSIYANAPINTRPSQYLGARGSSVGIHTTDYYGGAAVTNSGSITSVTQEDHQSPGSASGIFMDNGYGSGARAGFGNTVLDNTGVINASLISSNASRASGNPQYTGQTAFGPSNTATGILAASTYGDVAITNAGAVGAGAQSDHYTGGGADKGITSANGISVVSFVGKSTPIFSAGDIEVTNSATGSITGNAESSDASGDTAMASGISGRVSVGSFGSSLVSAGHGVTIHNAGFVSATAFIANDAIGLATATGISAINGSADGFATLTNSGTVYATATSPGTATATGISTTASDITIALGVRSLVVATASGASGIATGLSASGGNVSVSNVGSLKGLDD